MAPAWEDDFWTLNTPAKLDFSPRTGRWYICIEGGVIRTFFRFVFRCKHRKTTFPRKQMNSADREAGTYVVCLDCGKQFSYDWERMRIGRPLVVSGRSPGFLDS